MENKKNVELSVSHYNHEVVYHNTKIGGLNKKLVLSVVKCILNDDTCLTKNGVGRASVGWISISESMKVILNKLGIAASVKKQSDDVLDTISLYLRDKSVKGSKSVEVLTLYRVNNPDLYIAKKTNQIDVKNQRQLVHEISQYCDSTMGAWADVRGSYDKMYKQDLKKEMKHRQDELKNTKKQKTNKTDKTKKKVSKKK